MLTAKVDAVVYLGLGLAAPAVARALTARGWDGMRVMNTAGIRGHDPEYARVIDGWVYVDMHSEGEVAR
jgi:branched-chain amino acid transport system substrate-binding protein